LRPYPAIQSLLGLRARGAIRGTARTLFLCTALGALACGGGGDSSSSDDGGGDGGDDVGGDGSGADGGGNTFDQPPLTDGVATLAGWSTPGNVDGPRNQALFDNPVNLVVTGDGDVLVADFGNSEIRKVTPEGDVSTISQPPGDGMFVRPFGLALAGDTLYVQTDGNSLGQPGGALWRMSASGSAPELLRDNVGKARGIAALPDGRLALADYTAHVLRIFSPSNGTLTLLAGSQGQAGMVNGTGAEARFNEPYDLVVVDGDLLVSDFGNNRIRRVTLDGVVTTYAGSGTPGMSNGSLGDAAFNAPQGLALRGDGTLFVTDTGNFTVRAITGDQVGQLAGDGSPGYRDSEDPMEAQIYGLEGVDIDPTGSFLYIADGNRGEDGPYHRVRRCTLE
jgi:sugar lactone lactonase YvrE